MPKETKKFINPLLRPSQDVEELSESATAKARKIPSSTNAYSMEEEPTTLPPPSNSINVQPTTRSEEIIEETFEKSVPIYRTTSVADAIEKYTPEQGMPVSPVYVTPPNPNTQGWSMPAQSPLDTSSSLPQHKKAERQEEIQSPTVPIHNVSQQDIIKENAPYIATGLTAYIESEGTIVAAKPIIMDELLPAVGNDNGRRRRGDQAFEKTHERITLWIDKKLKQGFEELAYDLDVPKAALLNEAIADLLKKHNSR